MDALLRRAMRMRKALRAVIACIIVSLAMLFACTTTLAYAWLTDSAFISNAFAITTGEEEPYVAIYKDPSSTKRSLVIDRSSSVPSSWNGRALEASWYGMEKGDQDFASDTYASSVRPSKFGKWQTSARYITEVVSGDKARTGPIHVLNPQYWFYNLSNAKTIDVSGITPDAHASGDVKNRQSIQAMFKNCSAVTEIAGLETWDMSGITDAESCFDGCKALTTFDISHWDVSSLRTIPQMFRGCSSLRTIDMSQWDLRACTAEIKFLFSNCSKLEEIKGSSRLILHGTGSGWDAFANCSKLKRLDLSGSGGEPECSMTYCTGMFRNCTALVHLDISGMKLGTNDFYEHMDMFYNLPELKTFITSNRMHGFAPEPKTLTTQEGALYGSCWKDADRADEMSGAELATFLEMTQSREGSLPFRIMEFNASPRTSSKIEPYAAVYDNGTSTGSILVMGEAAIVPEIYEGHRLMRAMRGFLENDEEAVYFWNAFCITEVNILCTLSPHSCKEWYAGMTSLTAINGLDNLDMNTCVDVSGMFMNCGVKELDVSSWHLSPDAHGLDDLFAVGTGSLETIDLGSWNIAVDLSFLAANIRKVTLSPTIGISAFPSQPPTTSMEMGWYIEGVEGPLDGAGVITWVNGHKGSLTEPITITSEAPIGTDDTPSVLDEDLNTDELETTCPESADKTDTENELEAIATEPILCEEDQDESNEVDEHVINEEERAPSESIAKVNEGNIHPTPSSAMNYVQPS